MKINSKGFIRITKKGLASVLISTIILTGSGLLYLFNPWTKQAEATWFNDNWAYRKPVSFTHNAAVSNTQVELDIDTTEAPDKFQSDCGDVRFTDINGVLLRYFLDSVAGACDTVSTDFDVLIPSIVNGTNVIYMYYGNPSASDGTEAADFSETTTTPSGGAPSAGTEEKGPSPTLYWKFDDGTGTNAEDQSINGLDGTLNNTPTWQTEDMCISGKCLWFDGANNENVSRADDAKLDFVAADNFTVQAWAKRNGASSANNFILTKAQTGYTGYKLYQDATGDYCFDVSDGTNTDSACTSAVEFDDDSWHFVQGVKAGTTSITLYVDGKQRAQDASIAATGTLANTGTFYIGVDLDGTSNEWLGFIDEVKVYRDNSARTAAQVQADFNTRGSSKGTGVGFGENAQSLSGRLANGLVGYWKMQETASPSVDSSGNSNSGTWSGNVDETIGKFGNGTTYDGTGDYVTVTQNSTINFGDDYTVSLWVKTTQSVAGCCSAVIVSKDVGGCGGGQDWFMSLDAGAPQFWSDSSSCTAVTATRTVNDGNWHLLTFTRVRSSGLHAIYIDGVYNNSITGNTGSQSNTQNLLLGSIDGAGGFYNGQLDDTRLYNRALSSAEISQLYNFAPGPVLYYKMDEGSANSCSGGSNDACDSSGTGNDGSWNGNVTAGTGKFGKGTTYDGSGDYILSTSNVFDPSVSDFTASAWFKVTDLSVGREVFTQQDGTGTGRRWLAVGTNTFITSNLGNTALNGVTAVSTGTWYHAALTKSGSTVTIYLNGIQENSGTRTVEAASGVTVIGIAKALVNNPFIGTLDDAKIYNYARTQAQIIEDMNAGHPAPGSPVGSAVAYWKMDEGYGTTANDSHPTNDNDLTLSSASWTNSGKFGKAWNGTGALWLSRADDADFDFAAAEDFGISLWAKSDAAANPGTAEYLVDKGTTIGYSVYFNTSGQAVFSVTDGTNTDTATTSTDFYDNAWHNIVAIKTGTTKIELFVDGISRASDTSIAATGTLANADSLTVGDQDATDDGDEFFGDIDEVKIFRLALTADQVKQEFNRGSAQVLGALSDNSTYQVNAANQEYCIPGDSTACAAPVGEWKLDEKTGTTANDTSTAGKTATITTGAGGWTSGKYGGGINFDSADTKIQTSSTFTVPSQMTIEAWIFPTSTGEVLASRIFILEDASDSLPFHRFPTYGIGSKSLRVNMDWTSNGNWETGTDVITFNQWNHVAITYDSSSTSNDPIIYVNGVVQTLTTDSNPTGTFDNSASNAIIGNQADQGSTFGGIIDHVRLFDYIRSPAQIAWDYNRGGPVGYWKFDECQGTSLFDSAGNSLTGTWNGAASGSQTAAGDCNSGNSAHAWNNGKTGKRNYSLNFDGTDDYVNVVDNNVLDATTGLTLSAWINKAALGTTKNVASKWSNQGGIGNQYSYYIAAVNDNTLSFQVDNDGDPFNAGSGCSVITTTTISASTWYHFTATFNSGTLKIYRDGIEQPTTSSGTCTSSLYQGTAPLTIGSVESGTTNWWNGQIDDARVYNYAMTATQVKTLMNDGTTRFGPNTGSP